ncbi:MAG: hypothetical protein AAF289_06680 [Cyanobacteria bacterium P01_A01_bin.135]
MDSTGVLISQIIGLVLAALVATLVYRDAKSLKYQGASVSPALWTALVFLLLIVFLPLYLILRQLVWQPQIRER